jgi:hypothetical protein
VEVWYFGVGTWRFMRRMSWEGGMLDVGGMGWEERPGSDQVAPKQKCRHANGGHGHLWSEMKALTGVEAVPKPYADETHPPFPKMHANPPIENTGIPNNTTLSLAVSAGVSNSSTPGSPTLTIVPNFQLSSRVAFIHLVPFC